MDHLKHLTIEHLAPNQIIVKDNSGKAFYSYGSFIVFIPEVPSTPITLGSKWKYSATTSKYRSRILNETTAETLNKLTTGIYRLED